ncbi:nuclear transport factor 2 family protein [Acaryochloris sp. IP29b_bin.137]|uniref:nuclear transport factor 2 family protein n=1 Tax=Acaryochloris sp. IP29b_bin.137 TaxID=2969217 RepID=UPI002602B94F|nr:nuclear transport factor 2 family protein [Acaryochloris sp. IP29b_bin.137]
MQDEQVILDANDAFYRAFEKKDLEAMRQVWSHGIACTCVHPGRGELKGWEAIESSWQKIFRNTAYLEIDTKIITVNGNGELAYVILIEKVLQVAQRRQQKAESMATNIFERLGQDWYLVHHHGSPMI